MPHESYTSSLVLQSTYSSPPGWLQPFLTCLCKGTAVNHNQQFLGKAITSITAKQWKLWKNDVYYYISHIFSLHMEVRMSVLITSAFYSASWQDILLGIALLFEAQ